MADDTLPALNFSSFIDPTASAPPTSGIGAALSSGGHAALASLNAIPASMGSRAALETMADQQRQATNASQRAGAAGIPQSLGDVEGPVDLMKYVGGQVAETAPVLGAVTAGSLAGAALGGPGGGIAAGAAAAYPLVAGQNLNTQYQQAGQFNQGAAFTSAVPQSILSAVAPENALVGDVGRTALGAAIDTGSRLGNAAVRGAAGATSQAAVGAANTELSEANKAAVDPNYSLASPESLSELQAGAAGGAVIGGAIGIGHGLIHSAPGQTATAPSPSPAVTSPDVNPTQPFDVLATSAFARRGGQTDANGMPMSDTDIARAGGTPGQGDMFSGQTTTDTRGQFQPGFDNKGNPLPNQPVTPSDREAQASAGSQGPLPAPSTQDAIDGLTQMHAETSEQLRQQQLAEAQKPGSQTAAIGASNDKLTELQNHLAVLHQMQGEDPRQGQLFSPQGDMISGNGPADSDTAAAQPAGADAGPMGPPAYPLLQQDKVLGDLQRQGPGLDTPPAATPNPNAQIAIPGQATPNPNAQIITPPRPTVGDQLIAAQRAKANGQMLDANQAGLLRNPPAPAHPDATVAVPPAKPGFQLTPDRPEFGAEAARTPPFNLEMQEGHPGQGELPLDHGSADGGDVSQPTADTQSGSLFKDSEYGSKVGWQTRLRLAWKDESDGKLQGFPKAAKDMLSAATPEDAAAVIRDKAGDTKNGTAYKKLDAMHRALTGESLEDYQEKEAAEPSVPEQKGPAPTDAVETPRNEPAEGGAAVSEQPMDHPVEGAPAQEPAPAVESKPSIKSTRDSQEARRAEDAATLQSITDRLDTAKTQTDFQQVANDLYSHSQTARTLGGRDAAHNALTDPKNGITNAHYLVAEAAHDDAVMAPKRTFTDANRAEGETAAPKGGDSGLVPGTPSAGNDTVAHLAQHASDPAVKQTMAAVMRNVDLKDTTVNRVQHGQEIHEGVANELATGANGVIAKHADGRMEIHVSPDAGEETVAHELVHAATLESLDDPANAAPFKTMMQDIKNRLAGRSDIADRDVFERHALGDVKEFVAYAATNSRFRSLMDQLDRPGQRSLWDRFTSTVAKVLGAPLHYIKKLLGAGGGDNIKSGSVDRFDAHFNSLLESRSPEVQAHVAEVKFHAFSANPKDVVEGFKEAGHTIWGGIKANMSKAMLGAMPTHVIVDQFRHILKSLPDVQRAVENRTIRQHELARNGAMVHDALTRAFHETGSLDRLHSVIEDAQTAMIDPRTEPMDRAQAFMKTAQEKLNALPKDATQLQRLRAEDYVRKSAAGVRLKDNWTKMSDTEKSAFSMAVEKMKASMEQRQQAANDILLRSRDAFSDPTITKMQADGEGQDAIDQHIISTYGKEFKTMDGAYAPLKRFGDWVVSRTSPEYHSAEQELRAARVASIEERTANEGKVSASTAQRLSDAQDTLKLMDRDGRHREVTFHETAQSAADAAAAGKANYANHDIHRFTRTEYGQSVTAANGATIGKIMEAVGKELPPELKKNVEQIIRDMYVDSLPDGSFAQSQQERSGVQGYSHDFSRSILDTMLKDSFQISTLEHSEHIGNAMKALNEERKTVGTVNANAVHDTLSARIDASTNFKTFAKWEQRVGQLTHVMYLGASPAFLAMNAMQAPMITEPMLAARFGHAAASAHLFGKAAPDVWKAIKKGTLDVAGAAHLTADEKDMLTRQQNLGLLNMTQLHDMAQAARSSNIIDPKTAGESAAKGMDAGMKYVNLPAQYIETVNRAASALAAYRLARAGESKFGAMDHGQATDYATKIIRDSHVDYSSANNPAWMKTGFMPGSRLLFQFKKYWLNMLSMTSSQIYDAAGHHFEIKALRNKLADTSLSDEVKAGHQEMLNQLLERKAIARRTVVGLYGMHLLTTGAMGVPFAGGAMTVANMMHQWFQDPEDKSDLETDFRDYVAHAYGTTVSDTLFHGVMGGLMGMGVTNRIGMGDLASPIRVFDNKATGSDYGKELLIGAMGPTVGLGLNMMDAAKQFEAGNYAQGTEKMAPKVFADAIKAFKQAQAGGQLDSNGKMVTPLDTGDVIKQALGITPERLVNAYAAKAATEAAKSAISTTRDGLIKQAAAATDTDSREEAQRNIQEYNDRNAKPEMRVTASEVLRARAALTRPVSTRSLTGLRSADVSGVADFDKD